MTEQRGTSAVIDPIAELRELAAASRSGEYVCVSEGDEVHVYLQHGRLAWAADTRHPFAFSRFLKERGGVPEARLGEVIEECARLHSPIGEKLIERGLATAELVQQGLHHQVELAIETLLAMGHPRAVFLTRKFRQYRLELTFELDACIPAPAAPSKLDPARLLTRLREQVPDLVWAQVRRGREVLEKSQLSGDAEERIPLALVDATLAQGLEVAIIRSDARALVGAAIPRENGTSLWCEVGSGAALGGAIARIWTLLELGVPAAPHRSEPPPPVAVGEPSVAVDVAIESLMREPELLGVLAGEAPSRLCGAARHESVAEVVQRRWELLALAPGPRPRLGALACGLWCLGTRLHGTDEALWMVAEGRVPQGLLWAQLPALERSLARHAAPAA